SALLLILFRAPLPARADLPRLAIVAFGVVLGFPLLSALAMQDITAARALVFQGLLPLMTALFGVVRGGERPRPPFWLFSMAGASVIGGFALARGADSSVRGDLLILVAVFVCGLGYAEGGALSRHLGGLRVIAWALVLCLPIALPAALLRIPAAPAAVPASAWWGLAYVSLFSMLIGFVFWYRGLALGGIAAVSQLQLLQPMFGLAVSALLLHEAVGWPMLSATLAIILCVFGARRFSQPAVRRVSV
ncbi:MAG TPA: DMT family transporter, partial [Magnetospirillaceae bacterium]|nr:DMT family transporter [Magnetospirillaceae bacterium]